MRPNNFLREKLEGFLALKKSFSLWDVHCTTSTRLEAVYSHSLVIDSYFLIFYWLFPKIPKWMLQDLTAHILYDKLFSLRGALYANLKGAYDSWKIIFIICSLISPLLFQAIKNLFVWLISIGFWQIKSPNILEILIFTSMSYVIQIYIPALFCFKYSTQWVPLT